MGLRTPQTLRDQTLAHFPPDTAGLLIEFNKHVAEIDADYIVFIARKSLRLYDLLVAGGGPVSQRHVLSDHVLDQVPEVFSGKRVALVDDTLILGTTLAAAKRKLIAAGAREVTSHVFAVDKENWCSDLILPERSFAQFDHQQMLTFCASEVAALSEAAIPYLSDFPFSELSRLKPMPFSLLHSVPGWASHALTTPAQSRKDVSIYSLLPERETHELVSDIWGAALFGLIELIKIRIFSARAAGTYRTRFVPLVTLRAVRHDVLDSIFAQLTSRICRLGDFSDERLKKCLTSPISKLRFVQYVLSLAIGDTFISAFRELAQISGLINFDLSEGTRLFGPWLRSDVQSLHRTIPLIRGAGTRPFVTLDPHLEVPALVPDRVIETTKSEYREFVHPLPPTGSSGDNIAPSLFTDLICAFIGLHKKYELPARAEVHRLGRRVLEVSGTEAPFRDRLKFGFVWGALASCLLGEEEGPKLTVRRSNLLSLLLDHLVDLGIAVPVLCSQEGILFRGYRYGEDVTIGDQEPALAYEIVSGYIEGCHREVLPKIVLEKLLVSLLRVGVAREFLTVIYGLSGSDGVARIGFHLHGAVSMFLSHDTIFADSQDSYLSRFLVQRGVLRQRSREGMYSLGTRPEASFLNARAVGEAHQLGWLMGLLSSQKPPGGGSLLDSDKLIVLTSCASPRDTAAAVAAELRVFARWYQRVARHALKTVVWTSESSIRSAAKLIVQGQGYLAINSARRKIQAYGNGEPRQIVESCSSYLSSLEHGVFLSSHWLGIWNAVMGSISDEERRRFEPWIAIVTKELLIAAMGLFTTELALLAGLLALSNSPKDVGRCDRASNKIGSFLRALSAPLTLDHKEVELLTRLMEITSSKRHMESPERSLKYGVAWIDQKLPAIRAAGEELGEDVINFGRSDKRINFSYVLWYDVIDGLGQKGGLSGEALSNYREKVASFKHDVIRHLHGLRRDAAQSNVMIEIWQGPLDSKDDEKHLFFTGTRGLGWLQQATKIVLMTAETHGICLRSLAINTNFAGPTAYKHKTSPTIEGAVFWEYLSRLKPQLKETEIERNWNPHGRPPCNSLFWIGDDLVDKLDVAGLIHWSGEPLQLAPSTSIDDASVTTRVVGGPVLSTFARRIGDSTC